jgi:hypothetical protein
MRFVTLAATLVFVGVVAATPVATAAAVRHTETLTDGTVVIIVHNGYVPMCYMAAMAIMLKLESRAPGESA